jgi:hypothetical protein
MGEIMAEGARRRICHVTESAWGTASGTAFQIDNVPLGPGLKLGRSVLQSSVIRSDRGVGRPRLGAKRGTFNLPFELAYCQAFEDHLASAMCAAMTAAGTATAGITTTVVAGSTNTMAGTGVGGTGGSAIAAGDWVKVSGFASGNVGNNGFWRCTTRGADLLTFAEAKDTAGASQLTACSSQSNIVFQKMGAWSTGSTVKSNDIEEAQLDLATPLYRHMPGAVVNTFGMSIVPDQIIKGNFGYIGKPVVGPATSTYTASTTAASSAYPIMANDVLGALRIDGTPVAILTGMELGLDNGADPKLGAFQLDPYRIALGVSALSGSLSLMWIDATYWTKYAAETRIALGLKLPGDATCATGYAVDIPSVFLSDLTDEPSASETIIKIPFLVEPDSTTGLINWKWNKLA